MKVCTACKRELPFSSFWKRTSSPDGYEWKCKECATKVVQANRDSKPVLLPPKGKKKCPRCKRILPVDRFAWNSRAKDNRQTYCKDCKHEQYLQEGHLKVVERTRVNRSVMQIFVDDYKLHAGCKICRYKRCAQALDPHHRDPGEKEFSIGEARARNFSIERVKKELEKCDILCANCHREAHYLEEVEHESS